MKTDHLTPGEAAHANQVARLMTRVTADHDDQGRLRVTGSHDRGASMNAYVLTDGFWVEVEPVRPD